MGAYIVKCTGVDKNADGSIAAIPLHCRLETGNGNPADGRKVKGTIHWVSAAHCVDAEVRLYDKLFTEANMNGIPEGSDYKDYLNPESVTVRTGCKLGGEPEGRKARRKVSSSCAPASSPRTARTPACTTAWSPCATASSPQNNHPQGEDTIP